MTDKLNFGVVSNNKVCLCGKHRGVQDWSPHERAQVYSWHRKHNINFTSIRSFYLHSYEQAHGKVEPNI